MKLIRSLVSVIVILFWMLSSDGMAAEQRIALVIGNGAYRSTAQLRNPPQDARLMARTLSDVGFKVIELVDGSREQMLLALRRFGDLLDEAGEDGVGLFYYAGHGVQVDGRNYMIPTTAEIKRESDVEIYAVNANAVLSTMAFARNRLNFVILDACRNNPFARSFRSATRGLARMDAPRGTLIAYATAPGDVAADGKGENSPYILALTEAIKTPGLAAEHMFKKARLSVMEATGDLQVPWESSSLTGEFFFSRAASPAVAVRPVAPVTVAPEALELSYWESIKDGPSKEDLEDFLARFPGGVFSTLASRRLEEMGAAKESEGPREIARASTYDGLWKGEYVCPRQTRNLKFRVMSGEVHFIRGTPGQPGYRKMGGAVSSNGTLHMKVEGVNSEGVAFTRAVTGRFSQEWFEGKMTFEHPVYGHEVECSVTLARPGDRG